MTLEPESNLYAGAIIIFPNFNIAIIPQSLPGTITWCSQAQRRTTVIQSIYFSRFSIPDALYNIAIE